MLQSLENGWKKKKQGAKNFIVRIKCSNHGFEFLISDLIHLWMTDLTKQELGNICHSLNPLIESSTDALVAKALSLLEEHFNDQEDDDVTIVEDSNSCLKLMLKAKFEGVFFRFEVLLLRKSSEVFYEEVFVQVLLGAQELNRRQEILIDLLEKKDQEIREYALEGQRVTRMLTTTFNKEEFLSISHLNVPDRTEIEGFLKVINLLIVKQSVSREDFEPKSDQPLDQIVDVVPTCSTIPAENKEPQSFVVKREGTASGSGTRLDVRRRKKPKPILRL